MAVKRYLVVPDLHVPFHDILFMRLILLILSLAKFDGLIQLGDALDFWQISRFDKNPLRKQTIAEDAAIYKGVLDEWEAALPKGAVIHQLEGNHEDRLRRFIWNNAAQLNGIVKTVPEMLNLNNRKRAKVQWHDLSRWRSLLLGNCYIHHGHYFNMHVAMGNLTRYPKSFIQGHTHRFQHVTNGDRFSASLGHGSNEEETAHQPTPTGWQQALGELIVINDEMSHLTPMIVNNGACIFHGQIVDAKKPLRAVKFT